MSDRDVLRQIISTLIEDEKINPDNFNEFKRRVGVELKKKGVRDKIDGYEIAEELDNYLEN